MSYHAARACAIAGYVDLYKELDVLPEVHIAEEASHTSAERRNTGSQAIYELILSQPAKYAIFNDYTRTLNILTPRIASCNADTAVFSSLAARQVHQEPFSHFDYKNLLREQESHDTSHYFNITEDWGIDDHNCEAPPAPADFFPLLYSPLPVDLPPINKNDLILVAAYTGDIDRYTRLRRPKMIRFEASCIIRGIYHNVFWAKWWASQVPEEPKTWPDKGFRCAINARRIMSDDIIWVTASTPTDLLPYNIWWPACATSETYKNLTRKRPDMLRECLRACIVADYQEAWDELLSSPSSGELAKSENPPTDSTSESEARDLKLRRLAKVFGRDLWREAGGSHNSHYLRDITAAVPDGELCVGETWRSHITGHGLYSPRSRGSRDAEDISLDRDDPVRLATSEGPYDDLWVELLMIDFTVFMRDVIGLDHRIWKERGSYVYMDELYAALEADRATKQVDAGTGTLIDSHL